MLVAVSDTSGQRLDRVALIALRFVRTNESEFHDQDARFNGSRIIARPNRTQFQRVGIS